MSVAACARQQAQRAVRRMALSPMALERLAAANFTTARDVLSLNVVDIMELLDLSHSAAQELLLGVSAAIAPSCITVRPRCRCHSRALLVHVAHVQLVQHKAVS
jgi:hypothetical protein